MGGIIGRMKRSSGRYARYPAVDRSVAPTPRAERFGGPPAASERKAPSAPVNAAVAPTVAPSSQPSAAAEASVEDAVEAILTVEVPEVDPGRNPNTLPEWAPDLSAMATPDVIAWVGDDPQRRDIALANEWADRQRKGLIAALTR